MYVVIIPKLADVSAMNNISQNTTKRKDIATTLLDAFSNMSESCILLIDVSLFGPTID